MFQQQVFVINMVLMVLDAVTVIAAGYAAHAIRSYESYWLWSMDDYTLSVSILFVMFVNNVCLSKVGLYSDRRMKSYWKLAIALAKAVSVDFGALAMVIFLIQEKSYSRAFLLYFAALTFLFLFALRYLSTVYINHIAGKGLSSRRLFLVGDSVRGQIVAEAMDRQLSMGHQIAGHLEINGNPQKPLEELKSFPDILHQKEIDEVIFAVPKDRAINLEAYLDVCSKMGIPVRVLPALWSPQKDIRVELCQGVPFMTLNVNNLNPTGLVYKRILDLAGGIAGCIILAILFPFVAAAIKLDSAGPVFFKQDRVGRNGRIFKLYKFRSMCVDAECHKKELMAQNEMQGPMFKLENDPRRTRLGKFLRKTSLDEFPQFINVLKGEMSLVGTRPPTPDEVKQYELRQYKRISAKPGITGMWQVSGRNKITDFNEVVRLDCQYLENWRFLKDLEIIFKTCWVILARKGAQ
jgi:exopolysaccharide biosynthesis polyprenyl glycosylphosphotransferase